MKKGEFAYFANEGNFFDPHYSLHKTRKISKGQKVEIISETDIEGQLTVRICDGELMGEEFKTAMNDLNVENNN